MRGKREEGRGKRVAILGIAAVALVATTAAGQINMARYGINPYDPVALFRAGAYDSATKLLVAVPRSDSGWVNAQKWLSLVYSTVGKYDDAERVARAALAAPGGVEVANTLGELLMSRGKRAEAQTVFERAIAGKASDSLTAKLNIGILLWDRGERDKALVEFDKFIDVYNNALPSLTSPELVDVAVAVQYLGVRDPQLFKDALKALDRAISVDPENIDAKVLSAELFLQKYNSADAQSTYEEVLRLNPALPRALIGAAQRLDFDNQPGADSLLKIALTVNPNYVPARLFLAGQVLDIEDFKAAQTEVDRALQVDPSSREALALAATIKYLTGDRAAFESIKQRALQLNPRDGDFFVEMAEAAARVRLYQAAANFAREAIAADSMNWRAHGVLGSNLLRLGKIEEGRKSLDLSFAGDPYNVWNKNTLDLLDTYKNYDIIKTPHFEFMIEKGESGILGVYLGDLAEEAYKTFSTKYGYTPPPPIRIEVYRSHADFSVRTIGLAGIGALGVSFGTTLAFDSPAAKDAGPFNWGSTVWHELAHTFTLGVTDHKVPRWLSEGLSVYEEHLAKPGWGFGVTPSFLIAFREGKLAPVSRLNDGFMHPDYPEQVQFSYYQASLVNDLIARDHGAPALTAMLQAYKGGQTTEQVFQSVLKTDPKAFDKKFDDYVRQRFAGPLAALKGDSVMIDQSLSAQEMSQKAAQMKDNYVAQMLAGRALVERNEDSLAIIAFERARSLIPDYGGENSPYPALAKLYSEKNDAAKLIPLLTKVVSIGESNYDAHIALAKLLELTGNTTAAADILERAMYINPFDIAIHQRLADLFQKGADKQKVLRERRAVVALNPVDRPEALYQLALAYEATGDVANAKKSVLRALEDAPNFEKAQELMLKLHGGER